MRKPQLYLAALLLCVCVAPAAAPSPSPTVTPTPSASASPSPTASPASTPAAAPITYTSSALAYRIDVPPPWRRSPCVSTRDQSKLPAGDGFVRVPEQEEQGTDVGYSFDVVQVQVHPNPDHLTPDRWLATGVIGGSANQTTESTTLDGRSALLLRPGSSGFAFSLAYLVPVADRIYVVGYQYGPAVSSNRAEMERMVKSFHPLTDQERSVAQPPPAPLPARSVETVADILANGFSRQDVDLLATVMAPCMSAGLEQAGGTFMPRAAFAKQLRDSFAGGLRVTVQSRPIEKDAIGTFIRATWNAAAEQQRDLYLQGEGDVWTWFRALTRQPVR